MAIYKPEVGTVFHGGSSCDNVYIIVGEQYGRYAITNVKLDRATLTFDEQGVTKVLGYHSLQSGHRPGTPGCATTASGKPRKAKPGRPKARPKSAL